MNERDTNGPTDEDVEGHRAYNSDRTIKDHVEPVTWEDDEGVEGHRSYSSSDRTIKDHVEPVTWEDDAGDQGAEGRG